MSSMLESLAGQLAGSALSQITGQLGTNKAAATSAISAALPMILQALTRNAASPSGASALATALDRDHSGGVLDDLAGFLGGGQTKDGSAILGHVLGNRQAAASAAIGKTSGLDAGSAAKLLAMLAPVVMGALGKAKRENNLDASGLGSLLGGESRRMQAEQPKALGLLDSLLDADNDGDVDLGDLVKRGGSLLGGLFGR